MNNYRNIRVTVQENIALITISRPDVLNALNSETVTELLKAVQELEHDPRAHIVIITGDGKAFVAGADITEMNSKGPEEARTYSELGHSLMRAIQNMGKAAIAAVNGYALGGGTELALACDIRIASENAQFGLPETILGIIPGWGATQRMPRLVGTAVAKELIFTGEIISARRALEIGLVNRVVPDEDLMTAAMDMARKIKHQGPIAVSHAKQVINRGMDRPLQEGCGLEIDAFVSCFNTEDQKEGLQAFIEKREPRFKGR